jgi:hypothetical protein
MMSFDASRLSFFVRLACEEVWRKNICHGVFEARQGTAMGGNARQRAAPNGNSRHNSFSRLSLGGNARQRAAPNGNSRHNGFSRLSLGCNARQGAATADTNGFFRLPAIGHRLPTETLVS